MVKIQVNSQGKAYFTSDNKVLVASNSEDTITATNNTGSKISNGEKVWINPITLSGSTVYSVENFIGNIPNFINQGNVTISNKIASNFSSSRYLYTYSSIAINQLSRWEAFVKFKTTNVSTTQLFYGIDGFSFLFGIDGNTGKCIFYASNSNTYWNIANGLKGNTVLQTNTDYYVKIEFTGSAYNIYLSATGAFSGEESTEITLTSSSKCASGVMYLGIQKLSTVYYSPLIGSIDLSETYFKSNGYTWTAYLPNVSRGSITGIAKEVITSGSAGSVLTVLGE